METPLPNSKSSCLESFFAAMMERFDQSQKIQGVKRFQLSIGNKTVCLSLAGEELDHLTRPLKHHAFSSSEPDLSIFAWTGPADAKLPAIPWRQESPEDSIGLATERYRINYHQPSGLLCMWDQQAKIALYWAPRAADLPFWELASPFRILFHWWAQSWGAQVSHAAAVGVEGHGVLLVGKSGSGKSTAALACLRQGMEFIGDDYVLLTADPKPKAHSLYSSAKMHDSALSQYFPDWMGHIGAHVGPESKGVLYLNDLPDARPRPKLELKGILAVIKTEDQIPSIVPTTPGNAWLSLAPSTVFQLPDCRQKTLAFFSGFTRRLGCFGLRTGNNPERISGVLREFLTSIASVDQEARFE